MKTYNVKTYTKKFAELVNGVVADTLIEQEDELDAINTGKDPQFLKYAALQMRGVFARHWIGGDRRNVPKDIFDLEYDECQLTTDVFEQSDNHKDIQIPVVLWEGESMSIMDIPNLAYAEEVMEKGDTEQVYYAPDATMKRLKSSGGMAGAMTRVLQAILKGENPKDLIVGKDPVDDL